MVSLMEQIETKSGDINEDSSRVIMELLRGPL